MVAGCIDTCNPFGSNCIHISLCIHPEVGRTGRGTCHVSAESHGVNISAMDLLHFADPLSESVCRRVVVHIMHVRRKRQNGCGAYAAVALHRTLSITIRCSRGGLELYFLAFGRVKHRPAVRCIVIAFICKSDAGCECKQIGLTRRRVVKISV